MFEKKILKENVERYINKYIICELLYIDFCFQDVVYKKVYVIQIDNLKKVINNLIDFCIFQEFYFRENY